jgi:hypothetical protein
MSTRILLLGLIGIASVCAQGSDQKAPPKKTKTDPVNYYRDIEPILNANCVACHQETMAAGGLRLDAPENLLQGGASGAVSPDPRLDQPGSQDRARAKTLKFLGVFGGSSSR